MNRYCTYFQCSWIWKIRSLRWHWELPHIPWNESFSSHTCNAEPEHLSFLLPDCRHLDTYLLILGYTQALLLAPYGSSCQSFAAVGEVYSPGKVSGFAESQSRAVTPTCKFELWPLSYHSSSITWHMLQAEILHDMVTQPEHKRENYIGHVFFRLVRHIFRVEIR